MRKFFLISLICICFVGCGDQSTQDVEDQSNRDIKGLIEHFKSNELHGDYETKAFVLIGALDGGSYIGEDFQIEIYEFAEKTDSKKRFKIHNGKFGLLLHYPQAGDLYDKIVSTFKDY